RLSDNPWMTAVFETVADIIDVPVPEPEAPGPFRYAEADQLLTLLDRAGFNDLAVNDWRGALPIGGQLSPAQSAHFALASFSSFGELLAQAGDEAYAAARQSLTARFSRYQQNDAVRMEACVHIATGTCGARQV